MPRRCRRSAKAAKLGNRAATVGFDWPGPDGVRAKIDEELEELDAACSEESAEGIEEELGDLLFSVANLARHLQVDPEQALQTANRKFVRRFHGIEAAARSSGRALADLDLPALDALWKAEKNTER